MLSLPTTATAPFCPSEVRGSIEVPKTGSTLQRLMRVLGPGLLVSVGYMDPGNWATDIEAGSRYGYALLWVVLMSSLAAISPLVMPSSQRITATACCCGGRAWMIRQHRSSAIADTASA